MNVRWCFRWEWQICSWEFCWVGGEGFGGLDASVKLIQMLSLYHGDGMLAVAIDDGRHKVRECGESVGIEGGA